MCTPSLYLTMKVSYSPDQEVCGYSPSIEWRKGGGDGDGDGDGDGER